MKTLKETLKSVIDYAKIDNCLPHTCDFSRE